MRASSTELSHACCVSLKWSSIAGKLVPYCKLRGAEIAMNLGLTDFNSSCPGTSLAVRPTSGQSFSQGFICILR